VYENQKYFILYQVDNIVSVYANVDLIFNRRARTTVKSIFLKFRIGIQIKRKFFKFTFKLET